MSDTHRKGLRKLIEEFVHVRDGPGEPRTEMRLSSALYHVEHTRSGDQDEGILTEIN